MHDETHAISKYATFHAPRLTASLPLEFIIGILIFVPELNSDLVIRKSEELFAEFVGLFFVPFLSEKADNSLATGEERIAVSPNGIYGSFQSL